MKISEIVHKYTPELLTLTTESFIEQFKQKNTYRVDIQKCLKQSSLHGDPNRVFWATLKGRTIFLWTEGALERKVALSIHAQKALFTAGVVTAALSGWFLNHNQAFSSAVTAGIVFGGALKYLDSLYENFEEQLALREIQKSILLQRSAVHVRKIKASAH